MTSQIPGFTNDDRSLFIEIVIGIPKIRKYIETYGKQRNSDETLGKLRKSLEAIQYYVEHQNEKITDEARQLRVALVMDSRSPKLFFLPNLDDVDFDVNVITESEKLASQVKSGSGVHTSPASSGSPDAEKYNADGASVTAVPSGRPKSTIPHCPECGSSNVSALKDGRYRCKDCGVKRAVSKVIWK
jgi:DNA-directed RNA polymerase subunit RPC12/RpoP